MHVFHAQKSHFPAARPHTHSHHPTADESPLIPPAMNLHIKDKEQSEEKTEDAEMMYLHHGHYLISLPILFIYPISFSFFIPFILRNGYDV